MKKLWVIVVLVVVICFCMILAGVLYFSKTNPIEKTAQISAVLKAPAPPEIKIYSPAFGGSWRVNDHIPLQALTSAKSRIMAFEVWIDGKLFGTRDDLKQNSLNIVAGEWFWQPGTVGAHTILFRSVDQDGLTAYSDMIRINAREAVEAVEAVKAEKGQTLTDLAASKQVDLEKVKDLNPAVNPDEPLAPGKNIFIPHPPVPVKWIELSALIPYGITLVEKPADKSNDWITLVPESLVPFIYGIIQKPAASSLPAAPTLVTAQNVGACDVSLEFKDNANNEDGFRIYRSNPEMKDFTKAADLPMLLTKNIIFTDKGLHLKGKWAYYAVAFNAAGESKSLPVTLEISDASCFPKEPQPSANKNNLAPLLLKFDDLFKFTVDENVEQAYIYLTINDQTRRIPDGNDTFLQGSGYKFDLTKYLLAAAETLPSTTRAYHIYVELWGWKDNKPYLAGSYTRDITDFTLLLACQVTPSDHCDGDNSLWTQNIVIPEDVDAAKVMLRFKLISFNSFENYVTTMAAQRVPQNPTWFDPFAVFGTDVIDQKHPAFEPYYFFDSLGPYFDIYQPGDFFNSSNSCVDGKLCKSKTFGIFFKSTGWFKIYYEVQPRLSADFAAASNRVYVMHKTLPAPPVEETTPKTPSLPDLYDVEFLKDKYTPALPADPAMWGCIRYLEDADGFLKDHISCPKPIPNDPCSGFGANLACIEKMAVEEGAIIVDTWDYIAASYTEAFSWIANQIAGVIPGCSSSDTCQMIVLKTVQTAWTYVTGLPSSLPSSSELASAGIDSGLDYIVGFAVEDTAAGLIDDSGINDVIPQEAKDYFNTKKEEFKQLIKDKIKDKLMALKRGSSGHTTESCLYPDIAHSRGLEPVCPSGAWEPAPGSQITPPTVQVKITRKAWDPKNGPDPFAAASKSNSDYGLKITSHTLNTNRVGTIIPWFDGYVENYPTESIACKEEYKGETRYTYINNQLVPCWFVVNTSLEGTPFKDTEIPIPVLKAGENMTYTIELKLNRYYYPEHLSNFTRTETDPDKHALFSGDDWGFLYFFGETRLHVEEVCKSNLPAKLYCGSSDDFTPPIPTNP